MLTHWTRDRQRGQLLALEWVVRKQTRDTARLYGLHDRGTLEPGMLADVNIIDYEALQLEPPVVVSDLPAGGSRLVQRSRGYAATIKSGVVTFRDGVDTGRPSRALGPRSAVTGSMQDTATSPPSASPQMIDIGRRMIANILADTTDLGSSTFVGDGSVFTDPDRFERDREVLFRRTPQVIAWAGDVAEPGDIVAREVAGVPVVVARHRRRPASAFLNACSHRGMTLCDGIDNRRRLTCPYHGWNYDLEGNLVGIPNRDRFPELDIDERGLLRLPVAVQAAWSWWVSDPMWRSTGSSTPWSTSMRGSATTATAAAPSGCSARRPTGN